MTVYCDMESDGGGWTLVWVFNKEGLVYSSSSVWNPISFFTGAWWKLSDTDINSILSEYYMLEPITNVPCDEKLFCNKFTFDYSAEWWANNQTTCSQSISGTYEVNSSHGSWYPFSHHNARDVWLRSDWNTYNPLVNCKLKSMWLY